VSKYNSIEFGVPNGEKVQPFAWLGADDVTSSLSSGVITYGATSYVPQTGKALQSAEVEPPGMPGGSGVGKPYTFQEEPWGMQGAAREAQEAPGLEAGREREAEQTAEKAILACLAAGACGTDPPKEILLSLKGTESLLGELESADGAQGAAASTIDALLDTETADIASFATSVWLAVLETNLQSCAGEISPATRHGGCLLVFDKFETEGYLWPEVKLGYYHYEMYDGVFHVYACEHKFKKIAVCPEGNFDRIFTNR
jgi:hypothetical protein